jgi:hypothetical protein
MFGPLSELWRAGVAPNIGFTVIDGQLDPYVTGFAGERELDARPFARWWMDCGLHHGTPPVKST